MTFEILIVELKKQIVIKITILAEANLGGFKM